MPTTFYTEEEYQQLEKINQRLTNRLQAAETMRPQWAMGYTSDSMAAQATSNAMHQMWNELGVTNQTQAMERIRQLMNKEHNHE
jgi:hypothetical protein